MQRIIDLIEETLDADISPQELADRAGYSLWHFLHLFREATGMPLSRWRMRRRLAHALWHISGGMRVTDAALRWGFDTRSGFFRAFRREYGCSPAVFIVNHRVRRPSPPKLKEEFCMLTREGFCDALAHWKLDLPLTPVIYPHSGEICAHAMQAGAEYVIRVCEDDHVCRMSAAVAEALSGHGLPAAEVIPLPDGSLCLPVPGGCVMLQRRLPGEPLRTPQLLENPQQRGEAIGRALAGLHLALGDLPDAPLVDTLDMGEHLLSWAYPRAKEGLPSGFPQDFSGQVAQLTGLPQSVIHRDPNPSNLIGTPAGVGFVDFALSVRACRIFDPCYMATAVLSESFGRDELPWETAWPVFARAVLAGYDAVSPLSAEEWRAAPVMMLGNELLALAAFADSSRYREVYETNRRMLAWMTENMPL